MLLILIVASTLAITSQNLSSPQEIDIQTNQTKDTTSQGSIDQIYKILDEIRFEIEKTTPSIQLQAILIETLDKIKGLESERYENFTEALLNVRKALISFYLRTNRYPIDLKELIPEFLKAIPYVKIHSDYGNSIKYIRTTSYDKDYTKAVDSTTEYLYFADPKSSYWGFFIINSTSTYNSTPYYKY